MKTPATAQQICPSEQTLFAEQKTRVSSHSRGEANACFVPQNTVIVPPVLVLQQGHSGLVSAVAFAPNTTLMATGGMDGTARIWDNKTGELVAVCTQGEPVADLAFSRNGQTLVTFSASGLLRFWNTQTGVQIAAANLQANYRYNNAFTCDGNFVTTFGYRGQTQVWDMTTGTLKSAFDWNTESLEHYGRPLKLTPDGKTLVFLREEQEEADPNTDATKRHKIVTLELADALSGQSKSVLPAFELRANQSVNTAVAFSADSGWMALGSEDGNARLWNLRSGKLLPILHCGKLPTTFLRFSADGKRLATASNQAAKEVSGDVTLWDTATGKLLSLLTGKPDVPIRALCFSHDGLTLAAASTDGIKNKSSLQFWDVLTGKSRAQIEGGASSDSLTYSPDDSLLISRASDGALSFWSPRTPHALTTLGAGRQLMFPTYSPDGTRIAAMNSNGFLQIWEAMTGRLLDNFALTSASKPEDRPQVTEPVFAPDGQSIAYMLPFKSSVEIYDLKTRKRRTVYTPDLKSPVRTNHILFAPDGKTLAVSADYLTRVIDLATGSTLTTLDYGFTPYTNYAMNGERSVAEGFSNDGKSFIGLRASDIVIIDIASGQVRKKIPTGRYQTNLSLSHDGSLLAALLDREVQLYDVATGILKSTLKAADGEFLYSIVLSPDGRRAFIRSGQNLRVCDIATGQMISMLNVTQPEGSASASSVFRVTHRGDARFAFTPDGRYIGMRLPNNRLTVWETATGKPVTSLTSDLLAAFPPELRRPLGTTGGTLAIHDPLSGDPLVMLTAFPALTFAEQQRLQENPDDVTLNARPYAWLAQTPDGFYEGSADITTFLRWNVSGMLFPGTRYAEAHHQPSLVQKALSLKLPVENKNK